MKKTKNVEKPVIRMIWSDDLGKKVLKQLRKQVNNALKNPDYCIIANYTINYKSIEINKDAKFRFVYSDRLGKEEIKDLKEQVDKALTDPNFVIVTNYEVNWDEVN
jgi:predicted phage-related endonuclease